MYVEVIISEGFSTGTEYADFYKGDKISGNVRSYKQDFINLTVLDENPNCVQVLEDEFTEDMFHWITIRLKIDPDSIKRVLCGCGENAVKEINGEYLCKGCEYEEPEDHSYLCQTPWESD